ncbi:MAG: hypothetical protein CSA72_13220 [Rhodobacterales bacterium]|nr:MAG: hypothetical protein CSA72_13220 [Rhodobacterales bacterium]
MKSTGDSTNDADYKAVGGVSVHGEGTVGGQVTVTAGDTVKTTTVGPDGTWSVVLDGAGAPEGEYEAPVTATITDGGKTASTSDVIVVDTLTTVDFAESEVGGNGIVNHAEEAAGVTLTGTTEAGASVVVTIEGVDYNATVTGTDWSLDLPAGTLRQGEYDLNVTVTATDSYGNTAQTTGTVEIDTVTTVTLADGTKTDGMVVNAVESTDGTILSGTAEAGATVTVTANGHSHTVTADGNGQWAATFAASELPTGETTVPVAVSAQDVNGNVATTSGTLEVDTYTFVTLNAGTVNDGMVVNDVEALNGTVLSGTAQPNATVEVTMNGHTHTVTADGNGNWQAPFSASDLPQGDVETTLPVAVKATDENGNVATTSGSVELDTYVNELTTADPVEGDNIVNAAEAADGITLTGTVEAGSEVFVTLNGPSGAIRHQASVDANGNWSVDYSAADLGTGDYQANVLIEATDAAGNVDSITDTFRVDTTVPDAPEVLDVRDSGTDVAGLFAGASAGTYEIDAIDGAGTVTDVAAAKVGLGAEDLYSFSSPVPDGSDLLVTAVEQGSGNSATTYFAQQTSGSSEVVIDVNALSGFDVRAIDLDIVDSGQLTLTADDIRDLSTTTNELIVLGDALDHLTVDGAQATGQTRDFTANDGSIRTLDVYTMGTGTDMVTLLVDDELQMHTTVAGA